MRFFLVAICFLVTGSTGHASDDRPNIVLLLTDDQRQDALGFAGNSIIETPVIDDLARHGVWFHNAFVTTSICMTSRASIMLGQYAARHGINDFRTALTAEQLDNSYFGRLKAAGYAIGFVGKWGVGPPPKDYFDNEGGYPGQGKYYNAKQPDRPHMTRWLGNQAIEFLAKRADDDRPFCLSVSFKAPHVEDGNLETPFNYDRDLEPLYQEVRVPEVALADPKYFEQLPKFLQESESRKRWRQRFADDEMMQRSLKGYFRLVTGVDRAVGRIRAELERIGKAEPTVIIFSSDHGFYLGERGLAGKWYPHDVSIRVPLIVYDPRQQASDRGRRSDKLALNVDLAPTILDYAGVATPEAMQGRSLKPLADGKPVDDWPHEFFYEHRFQHPGIPQSEAVRTKRWKYVKYVNETADNEELYDLEADPLEKLNLAEDPSYAQRLAILRRQHKTMRLSVR